jgi:cytochrome c heme-lyase
MSDQEGGSRQPVEQHADTGEAAAFSWPGHAASDGTPRTRWPSLCSLARPQLFLKIQNSSTIHDGEFLSGGLTVFPETHHPYPSTHWSIVTHCVQERRVSTIPKTTEHNPQHQQDDSQFWEYPSQQMFYNAMKRKGHSPTEGEMSTIVGMHNAVNERSWGELLHWEHQLHPETADVVRLKKFSGDATKISPKARLRALFGSELPFDRHDWIVVRGEGGEEVRYVIDFYQAKAQGAAPIAFHLDVRPAVDSFSSAFDRVRMSFRKLTGEAQRFAAVRQSETVAATAGTLPPGPLQRKVSSRWSNTGTSTS